MSEENGNKVSEEKAVMPRGLANYNMFQNMLVVKADSEESLVTELQKFDTHIVVKAMYYSPTSEKHVAYVLTNKKTETLNKG